MVMFFNAECYGCNMEKFKMFKFRSMKMNVLMWEC